MPLLEVIVEFIEVSHLEGEIDLFGQGPLEGHFADRKVHAGREKRGQVAEEKEKVDVSNYVLVDVRMAHLYGHLLSLVLGHVDLAHRS